MVFLATMKLLNLHLGCQITSTQHNGIHIWNLQRKIYAYIISKAHANDTIMYLTSGSRIVILTKVGQFLFMLPSWKSMKQVWLENVET